MAMIKDNILNDENSEDIHSNSGMDIADDMSFASDDEINQNDDLSYDNENDQSSNKMFKMPTLTNRNITYVNRITEEDYQLTKNMIEFSFQATISENSNLINAVMESLIEFDHYLQECSNVDEIKMKGALAIATHIYGNSIEKINRSQEERLVFEAVFLDLCSRRNELVNLFYISSEEFLSSYPECHSNLVGTDEYEKLFQFRNLMKLAMHLIPPLHNKNHLLDLVTRLIEGKSIKHITGTGATKATRLRVNIILKEGNLIVPKRPPRKTSSNHKSHSQKQNAKHKHNNRRGRPRKHVVIEEVVPSSTKRQKVSSINNVTPLVNPTDITISDDSKTNVMMNIIGQHNSAIPIRDPSYNILDTNFACTPLSGTYGGLNGGLDSFVLDMPLLHPSISSDWFKDYTSTNYDNLKDENTENDPPLKELLRQTSLFGGMSN